MRKVYCCNTHLACKVEQVPHEWGILGVEVNLSTLFLYYRKVCHYEEMDAKFVYFIRKKSIKKETGKNLHKL